MKRLVGLVLLLTICLGLASASSIIVSDNLVNDDWSPYTQVGNVDIDGYDVMISGYGFAFQDISAFTGCNSSDKKFKISFDINVDSGMTGTVSVADHVTWYGDRVLSFDSSQSDSYDVEFDCRDWKNSENTHMIVLATS